MNTARSPFCFFWSLIKLKLSSIERTFFFKREQKIIRGCDRLRVFLGMLVAHARPAIKAFLLCYSSTKRTLASWIVVEKQTPPSSFLSQSKTFTQSHTERTIFLRFSTRAFFVTRLKVARIFFKKKELELNCCEFASFHFTHSPSMTLFSLNLLFRYNIMVRYGTRRLPLLLSIGTLDWSTSSLCSKR